LSHSQQSPPPDGAGRPSFVRQLLGDGRREVWPRWAERVGGSWKKSGVWSHDTVVIDVGDWSITVAATADVVGPNQGVTCTVVKAPFHNPRGLRFTLQSAHIWDRIARRFATRDLRTGDEGFDRRFRLTLPARADAHRDAVEALFHRDELRATLPGRAFNHLTILDHEGLAGPRYGRQVDVLYYEEPRILIDERALDDLLLSYAHLLEQLEGADGIVDDVKARLGGQPPTLAARVPTWLRATLQRQCTFFAGHVEREGDEMVARVQVPELGEEVGELRVGLPALPGDVASLTALLPLPSGEVELPIAAAGAVVTWRPHLLDVRAPVSRLALEAVLADVLDVWHRAVRERLGLITADDDDDDA
jgi:hypothetical protein